MGPQEETMDGRPLSCVEGCKLLRVTGVLTLDDDGRLQYFCDQCDLSPLVAIRAGGSLAFDELDVTGSDGQFHA